jgi:hypothetical protein
MLGPDFWSHVTCSRHRFRDAASALDSEEQDDLRESLVDIIVANTDLDSANVSISFSERGIGNGTVVSITYIGSLESVEFSSQVDQLVNGGFFDGLEVQGVGIDTIVEACSVLGTELVVVNNTPTCKPCDHGHTMRIGDTRCRQCGVFDTSIKWTKIGFVGSCAELGAAEDRQRAIDIAAGEASEDDDPCGTACLIGILLSVFGIVIPPPNGLAKSF